MNAVWMRVRTELRSGRKGVIGLILLVGFTGAIVLTAAAGARRNETAFPRMLASARSGDALISPVISDPRPIAALTGTLPGVASQVTAAACFGLVPHGTAAQSPPPLIYSALAGFDGRYMYEIERPNLISGRLPNEARADEVAVNRFAASALDVGPGDRVDLDMFVWNGENQPPGIKPLHLNVTGVVIFPNEVIPSSPLDAEPTLFGSPAFTRANERGSDCGGSIITLAKGASLDRVRADVAELGRTHPDETGGEVFFQDSHRRNVKVSHAIRPQSLALWLFAALAAATSLIVVGQILARQVSLSGTENPALRAVGMSRGQLFLAAMARTSLICFSGAVIAIGIAFVASPLAPIGPARLAEPHPGFSLNLVVVGLGAVGFALALIASVALPAWVAARARATDRETPSSRIARALADSPLPPTVSVGVSMALEPGRGRTAVPVRSALIGAAVAVAAVVGAAVFATSLSHLIDTPSLYGWRWDAIFDTQFGGFPSSIVDGVAKVPGVAAAAGGHYGEVTIGRTSIPAIGVGPATERLFPRVVEGKAVANDGELVLGTKTAEQLGLTVGDEITARVGQAAPRPMRVVGLAVFPLLGRGSFEPTGLGAGAAVAAAAMPDEGGTEQFAFILIDIAPGQNKARVARAVERNILALPSCADNPCIVNRSPQQPADIANYARIRGTPLGLAAALALLAVGTLAHTLGTAVRRRRRDLAVLKTLGFVRRQVSTTIVWQAATVALVAVVVGLPAGVAAGRWAWRAFSNQLGVPSPARLSLLAAGLAIPAAVLVANALAALPARAAARTRPAVVLRSE